MQCADAGIAESFFTSTRDYKSLLPGGRRCRANSETDEGERNALRMLESVASQKPPPQAVMRGPRESTQGFMPRIHLFSSQFHLNTDDEKG